MKGWREGVVRREEGGKDGGCGEEGWREGGSGGMEAGPLPLSGEPPRPRLGTAPGVGQALPSPPPRPAPGFVWGTDPVPAPVGPTPAAGGVRPRCPHQPGSRSSQVVAGPSGQSWPGGARPCPRVPPGMVRRDTVLPQHHHPQGAAGPKCGPNTQAPLLGVRAARPLPAEDRGGGRSSAWGPSAGKGGRWSPHTLREWSRRGCRWSATGDTSESARQRLRHRTVPTREGTGLPRGPRVMEKD